MQSVIIGAANVVRMLTLHRFSTDGVKVGGQPVAETPATQRHIAWFFALHYGLFHLAYLIFIAVASRGSLGTPAAYALCALTFAVNHAFSLRHNHERDAAGRPNIGTLMLLPYARVVPMHLMIMSGLLFVPGAGAAGLVFFGVLKTIADAFMHIVEHHVLAQEEPRP